MRPLTYAERIAPALDTLEDVLEDVTSYVDDLEPAEARPYRAVMHKLEEAIGPLRQTLDAADAADPGRDGL